MTSKAVWPAALVAALGLPAGAAQAQGAVTPISQAMVQAVPPADAAALNAALRRLARNAGDIDALIDAGNASLALDDIDAALGFFSRAEELSPQNSRVLLGLARATVRSGEPLRALGLFDAAQAAGVERRTMAADKGLAYDLLGDAISAQQEYRFALASGEQDDLRLRLAISQAISGDREGFETTIYPLVARSDPAAFRTRAFAMAILGEDDEAVAIADAVMPKLMSTRIEPYLRYMKRLTPSQQAAAANLGIFPRAAQIGRDSPQVAQYRQRGGRPGADTRLAPQGEPLGRRADRSSQRRRPDRARSTATTTSEPPADIQREVARVERQRASDPMQRASARPVIVRRVEAEPAPAPAPAPTPAPTRAAVETQPAPQPVEQPAARIAAPEPQAASEPVRFASTGELEPVSQPETQANTGVAFRQVVERQSSPPEQLARADVSPSPGFDLADLPGSTQQAPAPLPEPEPEPEPAPSVADAFAAFADANTQVSPAGSGAVDITAIKPPREVERAEPAPPAHPRRYWVQVATGRDRGALRFDWRRIAREADGLLSDLQPHVTPWGQANRLLAGPYGSAQEARNAMNELKKNGIDSFTYTSPEGEEIEPLG